MKIFVLVFLIFFTGIAIPQQELIINDLAGFQVEAEAEIFDAKTTETFEFVTQVVKPDGVTSKSINTTTSIFLETTGTAKIISGMIPIENFEQGDKIFTFSKISSQTYYIGEETSFTLNGENRVQATRLKPMYLYINYNKEQIDAQNEAILDRLMEKARK